MQFIESSTLSRFRRRPVGVLTRTVINILHERGHASRQELFKHVDHELIPSISRLNCILDDLIRQKRVKVFLPVGSVKGEDPFLYKLNPTRKGSNFPEIYGNAVEKRNLQWMKRQDGEMLQKVIEEMPEPANTQLKNIRARIRELKNKLRE